jgi:hypothetical protein
MTEGYWVVVDNAFNRESYKKLIGKRYPDGQQPSYAAVASERTLLKMMPLRELVAYWNVLMMGRRMVCVDDGMGERHIQIVDELLTENGIPHEQNKLIETKRVAA